jgi:hypothetical protein
MLRYLPAILLMFTLAGCNHYHGPTLIETPDMVQWSQVCNPKCHNVPSLKPEYHSQVSAPVYYVVDDDAPRPGVLPNHHTTCEFIYRGTFTCY